MTDGRAFNFKKLGETSIGTWSVMSEIFETGNRRPRLDISYAVECAS